jgi:hypothetical protein
MPVPSSFEMLSAASDYIGRNISERQFCAFFGGPSLAAYVCYQWILQKCPDIPSNWGIKTFLRVLHWLKSPSSSIAVFCLENKVGEKKFWRDLDLTLKFIDYVLPSFSLNDRYEKWQFSVPCAIIDTTTFYVSKPRTQAWQYLVGRNQYGIKYEVVCSIGVPRFIRVSGPYKGAASDATIPFQSGVLYDFQKNEALLADKMYRGNRMTFLSPISGHLFHLTCEERAYNYLIYRARQSIERIISRLKVFGIFHVTWRFSFSLHERVTFVCCKLVNLFLLFEPLG